MSGFLGEMAAASQARVRTARARLSEAALAERARAAPAPPPLRRAAQGFDLIAELKLRSPAAGMLGTLDPCIASRVTAYARAGVRAACPYRAAAAQTTKSPQINVSRLPSLASNTSWAGPVPCRPR